MKLQLLKESFDRFLGIKTQNAFGRIPPYKGWKIYKDYTAESGGRNVWYATKAGIDLSANSVEELHKVIDLRAQGNNIVKEETFPSHPNEFPPHPSRVTPTGGKYHITGLEKILTPEEEKKFMELWNDQSNSADIYGARNQRVVNGAQCKYIVEEMLKLLKGTI